MEGRRALASAAGGLAARRRPAAGQPGRQRGLCVPCGVKAHGGDRVQPSRQGAAELLRASRPRARRQHRSSRQAVQASTGAAAAAGGPLQPAAMTARLTPLAWGVRGLRDTRARLARTWERRGARDEQG